MFTAAFWLIAIILTPLMVVGLAVMGKRLHGFFRSRGQAHAVAATIALVAISLFALGLISPFALGMHLIPRIVAGCGLLYLTLAGSLHVHHLFFDPPPPTNVDTGPVWKGGCRCEKHSSDKNDKS